MATTKKPCLEIGIISLFPPMFEALDYSITGRAKKNGLLKLHYWNPRDYTKNKHRTVDDTPYGGGPGMVMMVQPLRNAIKQAKQCLGETARVIYLSPQGQRFEQQAASSLVQRQLEADEKIILLAGRYEGIDQRLIDHDIDEQWSIGDYVLSGGELAAMVMIDSMIRLVPGALGDATSAEQDSFADGLLDYPHYTRPATVDGASVPNVLLEGNHHLIENWRLKQALGQTWLQRRDLLEKRLLSDTEQALLNEFIDDYQNDEE